MSSLKNVVEKVEQVTIEDRYDMTAGNMEEIYRASKGDPAKMICMAFKFGYLQGSKVEKARQKRETE